MDGITSSHKIAKKARKIYNKEYRNEVHARAQEVGEMLGNALKPKPRWVPLWLWKRGLKIFIKTK